MRRAEDKVMTSMVYGKDTDKSMTGIKVGDYEAKSECVRVRERERERETGRQTERSRQAGRKGAAELTPSSSGLCEPGDAFLLKLITYIQGIMVAFFVYIVMMRDGNRGFSDVSARMHVGCVLSSPTNLMKA